MASDGIQELLAGFQQFAQGTREFALSRALMQADEARQEIQRSTMEEKEKRDKLRGLSDELVSRMSGLGASAAQIQAATGFGERIESAQRREEERTFQVGERLGRQKFAAEESEKDRDLKREQFKAELELKKPIDYSLVNSTDNMVNLPKEIKETVIPGLGFANSKEDAATIKEKKASAIEVSSTIDRMVKLSKDVDFTKPAQAYIKRSQINSLAKLLVGKMRIPVTGPGAFSDQEREFIQDALGNPGSNLALMNSAIQKVEIGKLNEIKALLQKSVASEVKGRGFTPFADKRNMIVMPEEQPTPNSSEPQGPLGTNFKPMAPGIKLYNK